MAQVVLANVLVGVTEFRNNPAAQVEAAGGPVAVLKDSEIIFYAVPAALYQSLCASKAATPEQLAAALREGGAERSAALQARRDEHHAIDHPKDDGFEDFTKPAGMKTVFQVPPVTLGGNDNPEQTPAWLRKHFENGK